MLLKIVVLKSKNGFWITNTSAPPTGFEPAIGKSERQCVKWLSHWVCEKDTLASTNRKPGIFQPIHVSFSNTHPEAVCRNPGRQPHWMFSYWMRLARFVCLHAIH